HIGYARRGFAGLVVAGACFIVPAMLLTGALGWAYVHHGMRPEARWLMYGLRPAILAIVAHAIWGLARTAITSSFLAILGAAAVAASLLGVHELVVLGGAGLAMAATRVGTRRALGLVPIAAPVAAAATPFGLVPLFLVFLKIGAVLFGSGYVLLAFMRADFVDRLHWLSEP